MMKPKRMFTAGAVAMGLALTAPVGAATIDFDDLSGAADLIADGYAGLQWQNFYSLDPLVDMPFSGYNNAVTSGRNVAYSGFDLPAAIGGLTSIRLDSGYFTAAYNEGLVISARGYDGDAMVHSVDFTVGTSRPTRVDFGWTGLTRVVFSAAGGTDRMFDMSGTNFAVDDLDISAVPEPATWLSMILGAAMIGRTLRRLSARRLSAA